MPTAFDALKSARVYLNDNNSISWSDDILMPLLREAHGELIQELDVNGIGVLKHETIVLTLTAGSLNLGSNQPFNMLEPISLMERTPGSSNNFFQEMIKVNFLPLVVQDQILTFWSWNNEIIRFIGATQDRDILLRYKGYLAPPQSVNDSLGVIYSERFLGPRIAALAFDSIGRDSTKLSEIADKAKWKLLQRNVLAEQTPVRRKGYRQPKPWYGPGQGTVISVTSGGGDNVNIRFADDETPTGVINGINQVFTLTNPPNPVLSLVLYLSGIAMIVGTDYTLVGNVITFGNPPFLGSTIRAWYRY